MEPDDLQVDSRMGAQNGGQVLPGPSATHFISCSCPLGCLLLNAATTAKRDTKRPSLPLSMTAPWADWFLARANLKRSGALNGRLDRRGGWIADNEWSLFLSRRRHCVLLSAMHRTTDRDPFTFGERPTDYPRLLENDLGAKNGMEWRWRRSKLRGDSKNGVVIC